MRNRSGVVSGYRPLGCSAIRIGHSALAGLLGLTAHPSEARDGCPFVEETVGAMIPRLDKNKAINALKITVIRAEMRAHLDARIPPRPQGAKGAERTLKWHQDYPLATRYLAHATD